jgi:DNA-binding SARP family transcriptional activator
MCNVEWVLPERSTLQQRKDLKAFVKNYLAHSNTTVAIEDFDALY